jgi:hypothetical protein
MKIFDDYDTPESAAAAVYDAAQQMAEDASELQSAWQDRNAGKIWEKFSRILERAAAAMQKEIDRGY